MIFKRSSAAADEPAAGKGEMSVAEVLQGRLTNLDLRIEQLGADKLQLTQALAEKTHALDELQKYVRNFEEQGARQYHEGVAAAHRAAALEVEVALLKEQADLLLARLLGKFSRVEYAVGQRLNTASSTPAEGAMYLKLLEKALSGFLLRDGSRSSDAFDLEAREIGRDWPKHAQTMIGSARLENLRYAVETVLDEGVPGDLIETGVWRGGACILMRGVLAVRGVVDRTVWVADSFAGLPPPDADSYPADTGDTHHTLTELAIPKQDVEANFALYGLMDAQVCFLEGWFKDTLPEAPIVSLAVLRLDGDMYGSTMDALKALYHKVEDGGFVIIDDYCLPNCKAAVDDFRRDHLIRSELVDVDGAACYWRRKTAEESGALASPSTLRNASLSI